MTTPIDALKTAEEQGLTGALEIKSPRASATFFFREGAIYTLIFQGQYPPPFNKRLRWSNSPELKKPEAKAIMSSNDDSHVTLELSKQGLLTTAAASEVARDNLFFMADEILLSWTNITAEIHEGREAEFIPGVTVAPITPTQLEAYIAERAQRIENFAQWANIQSYEVGGLTIIPGKVEVSPRHDADNLILANMHKKPTLVQLLQDSGGIGTAQIVSSLYRLYRINGILLQHDGQYISPIQAEEVPAMSIGEVLATDATPSAPPVAAPPRQKQPAAPEKTRAGMQLNMPTQASRVKLSPPEPVAVVTPAAPAATPTEEQPPIPQQVAKSGPLLAKPGNVAHSEASVSDARKVLSEEENSPPVATQKDDLDDLLKRIEAALPLLKERHELLTKDIDTTKSKLASEMGKQNEASQEMQALNEALAGDQSKIENKESEIKRLEAEIETLKAELTSSLTAAAKNEEKLYETQQQHKAQESVVVALRVALEEKEKEEKTLSQKIDKISFA